MTAYSIRNVSVNKYQMFSSFYIKSIHFDLCLCKLMNDSLSLFNNVDISNYNKIYEWSYCELSLSDIYSTKLPLKNWIVRLVFAPLWYNCFKSAYHSIDYIFDTSLKIWNCNKRLISNMCVFKMTGYIQQCSWLFIQGR